MYIGDKAVKAMYVGLHRVRAIYEGATRKWHEIINRIKVSGSILELPNVVLEERLREFEIYGKTEQKKGYLKAFNQLSKGTNWQFQGSTKEKQSDNSYLITSLSKDDRLQIMLNGVSAYSIDNMVDGHKYMMLLHCKNVDSKTIFPQVYQVNFTPIQNKTHYSNDWGTAGYSFVYNGITSSAALFHFYREQSLASCQFYTYEPKMFDLTIMYGEGEEPLTIADFEADNPNWWLEDFVQNDYRETNRVTNNVFPNPDYPQEIKNVNELEVVCEGQFEVNIAHIENIELTKWDKIVKRDGVWGVSKNSKTKTFNKSQAVMSWFPYILYPLKTNEYCYSNDGSGLYEIMYCDRFLNAKASNSYGGFLNVSSPKYTTIEEYNNDNSWSEVTFVYHTVLEQSFTPLPQYIQNQLNTLQTYIPTTTISNSADCEMSVEYATNLLAMSHNLEKQYKEDLKEVLG